MKPIIEVIGAVIERDKHILCALRSPTMSLGLNWEFPGWKLKDHESPKEAWLREIKELKCDMKVNTMVESTTKESDSNIICLSTYRAKIVSGTPRL
ncbi:8-oxo-dGTP diphosphatase [Halobacillus dabanensis]|uniref:8-oxo-dGTP diphosphatase n=1 Tax=Halobacillus dabanensis TaxID=240302 RepID=A0A1I4A0W0_HALDA|nr:8-oxo-dGTP diphosphatase MutT [Halobacillus dabanensis]SFK49419.1 8-oxo-dGTP diphosphatase [Halobacillus dabanensis]